MSLGQRRGIWKVVVTLYFLSGDYNEETL